MRVIAGTAKGRRLVAAAPGVRPVSDRAREGIFSSLGGRVAGAHVLDLYAGTGAMGIEALSRGADRATFVDRARPATAAIGRNLEKTGFEELAEVVRESVDSFLMREEVPGAPFDLVILDPPYRTPSAEVERALSLAAGVLDPTDWTVVLSRGARTSTHVVPLNWVAARRLEYGDSLVTLFRPARRP
jgi:16S rRNA (guanine966-N2)-methyltransferase